MVSSTGLKPIQTQDLRTEDFRRCKIETLGKVRLYSSNFMGRFQLKGEAFLFIKHLLRK